MSGRKLAIVGFILFAAAWIVSSIFSDWAFNWLFAVLYWLFFWFLCYLLPGALLSSPFWILGRHRAQWIWWEFSILIVPFVVWVICLYINRRGKDLPNIIEMIWLGCAVALAPIIRIVIGSRSNRKLVASVLIVAYCAAAVVLWAVVAPIPLDKH